MITREKPMSIQDVADFLHVTYRTVINYYRSEGLEYSKPKHRVYFNIDDVIDFVNKKNKRGTANEGNN